MHVYNRILGVGMLMLLVMGATCRRGLCRAQLLRRRRPNWRQGMADTRGDVPGWVLITLMSAVLVAGLLALAGPALQQLFNQAMQQVQP